MWFGRKTEMKIVGHAWVEIIMIGLPMELETITDSASATKLKVHTSSIVYTVRISLSQWRYYGTDGDSGCTV